jgi:tetratricopeptide (TPR) repeat protein
MCKIEQLNIILSQSKCEAIVFQIPLVHKHFERYSHHELMKGTLTLFAVLITYQGYAQMGSVKNKSLQYQNRAWKEYQAHKFETAVILLDSSIALDSSRPTPFILKSEALWFKNRFAEAAAAYEKWIRIEVATDSSILLVGAYVHLGMLYDKAGMFNPAKKAYNKAITTYENGIYQPRKNFQREEEVEYVIAFGLSGDSTSWKSKLEILIEKYKLVDLRKLKESSRSELLEKRFAPYMLNGD